VLDRRGNWMVFELVFPICDVTDTKTQTVKSTPMIQKTAFAAIVCASAFAITAAHADPMSLAPSPHQRAERAAYNSVAAPAEPRMRVAANANSPMGGGFLEFLFNGGQPPAAPVMRASYGTPEPNALLETDDGSEPARPSVDPRYHRQVVDYVGREPAGTVVIDTPNRFLFLVNGNGKAVRYGIGVGRPGFTWSGVKHISLKREWPDWTPPKEMLKRRPDLPRFMEGGPENPLGARAMYLGSSLYRIHGSNEPWTIGTAVSSGCIRMRNEDVIDLYSRVRVGTRVVVI
jgi:lipoprotein-anchoring transpeptidase ErfK/SrfK